MPFNVKEAAILGAGMWFAGLSTFFYKRKQTLPFKIAYFLAWPTLGSAVILVCMPSEERMIQKLEESGRASGRIADHRHLAQLQMQKMRELATEHPTRDAQEPS
eukprot:jgi/Botrbrau1/14355/Bobra.0014s0010.1